MYKSKLQQLCQQQKWALPKYTCIKDGDDHRPQFKASVVVSSLTFHTPSAANSSKLALNEAAQLAFLHFSTDVKINASCISDKEELTFKSRLQELCQKQKWALPKYTCIRDGEDHCPQFKASVVVRGVAFDTPDACNSSKQAINQAAQLSFLHFTSHLSNKTNCVKEAETTISSEDDKSANNLKKAADLKEGFKNKLKMYAQIKDLKLPLYSTEKEGMHCFKARVSVGEDWFTGDKLCATAEEAENSAAATALLALLTDAFHENDPRSYKMLLHKLASSEGFFSPAYKTIRSNGSFTCTVEVEGELFEGAAAESEKLAELNAAKDAYTVFIERKMFHPSCEILKLARRLESAAISDPQESATDGSPSKLISDTKHGTHGENEDSGDHKTDRVGGSSNRNGGSSKGNGAEMKSYLLSNKVRVFTCMPNMALPKGTVVLPIAENKWAMVTLEFPTEKAV